MPVQLTSFDQLSDRHEKRFEEMTRRISQEAKSIRQDLGDAVTDILTGSPPSGPARPKALRAADFPFARRHGAALWPTPPIGLITGRLLASIQLPFDTSNDTYAVSAVSSSVIAPYAKFIFDPDGTAKMVPRQVLYVMNLWSEARMLKARDEIMAFQLSLI